VNYFAIVKSFTKPGERHVFVPIEIKRAFELINTHLYTVEERIRAQSREFDAAVEGYVAYACESNGKRLRPALALLAGGATGNISSSHVDLAVILELIHAATLVHDDIMDGADTRRSQPTANARWGNSLSVLLGDCLFAHALKLTTNFPNSEIMRRIASASVEVCSGEIIQTQRRFDLKMSVADYLRVIEMKTAELFGVATELGAYLNEASPETISAMKRFGMKLGTAYQIYDDVLDIAGNEGNAGKTLGTDLRKGKLTLPILHLLQGAHGTEHERLSAVILHGTDEEIEDLAQLALDRGAVKSSVLYTQKMLTDAEELLLQLPTNKYRDGLRDICESLVKMIGNFIR